MSYYSANVCVVTQDIVFGEIVPTQGQGSEDVDKSRPVIRFRLGEIDRLWHAEKLYNLETNEATDPPACFKPRAELTNALDEALRSREGQATNSVEVCVPEDEPVVRATGQAAKDLKEAEAEDASRRAWAE